MYSSKRLPDLQKRYDKALNSPPKAPVVLDAETAEEVREEAHRTGHTTKFGNDDVQVILEGQRYTFKPDGRVIAQEDGVATSKEDQIYRLESLQRAIDDIDSITKGRSTDQLLAELEKVSVQYDEMNAQLISEFGESGRIFNRSA